MGGKAMLKFKTLMVAASTLCLMGGAQAAKVLMRCPDASPQGINLVNNSWKGLIQIIGMSPSGVLASSTTPVTARPLAFSGAKVNNLGNGIQLLCNYTYSDPGSSVMKSAAIAATISPVANCNFSGSGVCNNSSPTNCVLTCQ